MFKFINFINIINYYCIDSGSRVDISQQNKTVYLLKANKTMYFEYIFNYLRIIYKYFYVLNYIISYKK